MHRIRMFCLIVASGILGATLASAGAEKASYRNLDKRECPILDTPYRTLSGLDITYASAADSGTAGWGKELSIAEINGWVRFFDWENDSGSELETRGSWDTMVLQGFETTGGADSSYPLSMGCVSFVWSQRFLDGFGMQLDASPGIYSSLDSLQGDDFSVPAGITLIKAFSPDFAIFAGASIYPTFDRVIDPRAGFIWSSRDEVVVKLAYPESRFEFAPTSNLRFIAGARMMLWPEYGMGDKDPRKRLMYDESRAFGAIEFGCTDLTQISLQGGYVFGRKISFDSSASEVKLSDAPFVGIGINGRM